jgi:phosphatidylglycerol:prolipoprotein diacylglycerol transferase
MRPPFDPIIIEFAPNFAIHWYGVLIVVGILAGAYYAAWRAKQDGENPDHIWNVLTLVIILAIVGARIYHVLSEPAEGLGRSHYFDPDHPENLVEILYIWQGGLGIYGAAAGGALGIIIYALYAKLRPLQWLDYGAPALVLGQAIGRWGNFFNRELYGPPTGSSWWGLIIDDKYRIDLYNCVFPGDPDCVAGETPISPDTLFHPTFLYESLWCLLVFVVLAVIAHKWKKKLLHGDIVWGYLIGYPLGRFFIEHFFRPDAWMMGTMAAAQWFAIACVVGGVVTLVVRHVLASRAAPADEADKEAAGEELEAAEEDVAKDAVEEAAETEADEAEEPESEG